MTSVTSDQIPPGAARPESGHGFTSLADVARAAGRFGDLEQLRYGTEQLSFAEHLSAVELLAAHLVSRFGVSRGDRVAIAMRNYPEFSLVFWATQLVGAIAVPLNAWWSEFEMRRALQFSAPAVIVADGERYDRVSPWASDARVPVVLTRGAADDAIDFGTLITGELPERTSAPALGPDDPSTILFTSGTTGAPKGIVHSHGNHLANLGRSTELAAAAPGSPRTVQLATMPLFHITQLSSLYVNAALGATTILMHKWDAAVAVRLIEQSGVTQIGGVPAQIEQVLERAVGGSTLSSLRSVGVGATTVPPSLAGRIWETFDGRVAPGTGYGMTETTSSVTSISGLEFVNRPDSVGRAHPFNEVRIERDGRALPVGEIGEITARGPNVATREWDGDAVRVVRGADEFLPTGDLGRLDDEGFLYVVGRAKDMIIRSGENVYAVEVEAVLLDHPDILAAVVVGMPHPTWGEEVTAVIRPRGGRPLDLEALGGYLAARLAYFKIPTRFHLSDAPFPVTATGKVVKQAVRDQLAAATSAHSEKDTP